jgi:hypothetical protein
MKSRVRINCPTRAREARRRWEGQGKYGTCIEESVSVGKSVQ